MRSLPTTLLLALVLAFALAHHVVVDVAVIAQYAAPLADGLNPWMYPSAIDQQQQELQQISLLQQQQQYQQQPLLQPWIPTPPLVVDPSALVRDRFSARARVSAFMASATASDDGSDTVGADSGDLVPNMKAECARRGFADPSSSAPPSSSPPPSSWQIAAPLVQTLLGPCRGYTLPEHVKYCVAPGGTVDVSVLVQASSATSPVTAAALLLDPIVVLVTERVPEHTVLRSSRSACNGLLASATTTSSTGTAGVDDTDGALDKQDQVDQELSNASGSSSAINSTDGGDGDDGNVDDNAWMSGEIPGLAGVLLPVEPFAASTTVRAASPASNSQLVATAQRVFRGVIGIPADGSMGTREWQLTVQTLCGAAVTTNVTIEITCSDQVFCNGQEVWVDGRCVRGPPACIDPLLAGSASAACVVQQCHEDTGSCSAVWYNRTGCELSGCQGQRCRPTCAPNAECGSDGCGGVCGQCSGKNTACRDHRCVDASTYKYSCAQPVSLVPSLSPPATTPLAFPITFSHVIDANALRDVGDQVAFACSNFRTQPDFVFRLDVPDRGNNRTVGIDIRVRGQYNANVDTLLQIRKSQCMTVIDERNVFGPAAAAAVAVAAAAAAANAAGAASAAAASTTASPLDPIRTALVNSICNDNSRPPGELSSRIVATLAPGTYYVIVSTNPEYRVTPLPSSSAADPLSPFVSVYPSDRARNSSDGVLELNGRLVDDYLPMCENKDCGDDEHGGECGSCAAGQACRADSFECKPTTCTARCEGKVCGDDGCGGSCGSCTGALLCSVDGRSCINSSLLCNGRAPACSPSCADDEFCANDCTCHRLTDRFPDLIVKMSTLVSEMSVVKFNFSSRACALRESCIVASGPRVLLRFSVAVLNQGLADVVLPDPASHPVDFFFSPCHRHYHYNHFADYSLIRDGAVVLRGHKQAFCLEDTQQELPSPFVPCLPRFNCTSPGIQRGWSDYYGSDLDCQWIDITDLSPGEYLLRVEVNVNRQILESSFDNNVAVVKVRVPVVAPSL